MNFIPRGKRAFTLVEACICGVVLMIVIVALYEAFFTGRTGVEKGMAHLDRVGRANRLFEHCKRALRYATKIDSVSAPPIEEWTIEYIDEITGSVTTKATMKITAETITTPTSSTTITVETNGKRIVYPFEDGQFTFVRNGRLVEMTITLPKRPPLGLAVNTPLAEDLPPTWLTTPSAS